MKHFDLSDGGRMPALGLGTWKAEPGVVGDAVREAIRIGYRHIDCAPVYQNEAEIGAALRAAFDDGDVAREDLWITSKLWNDRHLAADVPGALERTLNDLGLDYLDLYLIHWPLAQRPGVAFPTNPDDWLGPDEAPLSGTWSAMEDAVRAGRCRHIGVSNFSIRKIRALLETATVRPAANQVESHPWLAQNELLAFCREQGIVYTAYSPLGSGDRAEGFKKDDEPKPLEDALIVEIAGSRDMTPAQVLIAWALQRDSSVIPKSSNRERLAQNFAAAQAELTADDMARLDTLDVGYRFIDGRFWAFDESPYSLAGLWD
jgi:alcohol dehydrogenase (NADP+)